LIRIENVFQNQGVKAEQIPDLSQKLHILQAVDIDPENSRLFFLFTQIVWGMNFLFHKDRLVIARQHDFRFISVGVADVDQRSGAQPRFFRSFFQDGVHRFRTPLNATGCRRSSNGIPRVVSSRMASKHG